MGIVVKHLCCIGDLRRGISLDDVSKDPDASRTQQTERKAKSHLILLLSAT